jgi:hypothetical protein
MRLWSSALIALAVSAPISAAAQSSSGPLTPWGAPDLQGIWDFRSLTPMERPGNLAGKEQFTTEEAAEFAQQTIRRQSRDLDTSGRVVPYNDFWFDEGTKVTTQRTSLIVDPPDGKMPALTPEAEKKRAAQREARRGVGADIPRPGAWVEDISASVRCIVGFNSGPPMRPSAYNNNMQLFQTREYVVILNEMVHDARIIPLDSRSHLSQPVSQWMGDSRGHWEGRTLVVETTNFREERTPFGASAAVRLVERFTRVAADTLNYEVTVNDPATWTKPWTFRVPMAKTSELMYEYACHEGNYGLYGILAAAGTSQK